VGLRFPGNQDLLAALGLSSEEDSTAGPIEAGPFAEMLGLEVMGGLWEEGQERWAETWKSVEGGLEQLTQGLEELGAEWGWTGGEECPESEVEPDLGSSEEEMTQEEVEEMLVELFEQEALDTPEVQRARRLIEQLPAEEQGPWWEELQRHATYYNQRDNADKREKVKSGGTCNFTSLAMCLQSLGCENPYPELPFDEALIRLADEVNGKGPGEAELTLHSLWMEVANRLGFEMKRIMDEKTTRELWEVKARDEYLAAAGAVLISLNGHVVRLEAVEEAGLVIDDPFGATVLLKQRPLKEPDPKAAPDAPPEYKKQYIFSEENSNEGKSDRGVEQNRQEEPGNGVHIPWSVVPTYQFNGIYGIRQR
jgi:hypothetical protein